jgi:hypothetical protein
MERKTLLENVHAKQIMQCKPHISGEIVRDRIEKQEFTDWVDKRKSREVGDNVAHQRKLQAVRVLSLYLYNKSSRHVLRETCWCI